MEQSIWTDFVAKQAPVIIFLAIGIYWYVRHSTKQSDKKDSIIAAKDEKLQEQSNKVMDLYGKAIEAQNRSTLISEQLLESVNKLNDKIK